VAAGGITTEACAAAVATTVGSLGWAAVGEAVLAVVRNTQLANLESAAALALKLCSLSPDKRCSGTAAAAAATVTPGAATAATTEQQHVKLELAAVKQEQVASGTTTDTTATVKSELTAAVKSEPAFKAEPTTTAAASADTAHTVTAAATVQDGAELVGRYVAALGLGLPIVDATAATGSSTAAAAADDDEVAVVGVAARHSLRTLTLPQAKALVNMLVTLATPTADAATTTGGGEATVAPVRCAEELVSCARLLLHMHASVPACYASCTRSSCDRQFSS
jgi:hypothetical protein